MHASLARRTQTIALMVTLLACAGVRAQVKQPVWTDEMFDQWVFQQERNVDGARQRLDSLLALRIEEVNRAAQLTDAQKKKLHLAGKGDMKRFFARYVTVKKKFQLAKNDLNKINQIWQDISPLQMSMQAGLFHEDSLLVKSFLHTLSAEQLEHYGAIVRERRAFRHRAAIDLTVRFWNRICPCARPNDAISLLC